MCLALIPVLGSAILAGHFCFVEEHDSGSEEAALLVVAVGVAWLDFVGVLVAIVEACWLVHSALDSYEASGQKIHI
ncbi:hypothetical protein AAC387_Pa02g1917 [Persea americana]